MLRSLTNILYGCRSAAFVCRLGTVSLVCLTASPLTAADVDFDRHIRPLLSDNCFSCHGPDAAQRKADLRLDDRDAAVKAGAFNDSAPADSELLKRILSTDPEKMMPPPDARKVLTEDQKKLISDWVQAGAKYSRHWAFQPPVRAEVPVGSHPIDHLVGKKLQDEGLQFSLTADAATLARRLSLDLIGLPPDPNDVKRLTADNSAAAFDGYVEQLLASPHFGERMALSWLDAVRFADTIGYHSDNPRNIYPYRDYVIASFNSDKPFDQFTVEQVAGDLLPDPTQDQLIASGFNRLLLTTEEGGAQAKDYEARYMGDRVRAVGTAWLGVTIGCSQCHDHKFDPITMRDFYSMGAFFADIEEAIIGKREDGLVVPSPDQSRKLQQLKLVAAQLKTEYESEHPRLADAQAAWEMKQTALAEAEKLWKPLAPREAKSEAGSVLTVQEDKSVLAGGPRPDKDNYEVALPISEATAGIVALQLEAIPHDSLPSKGSGRADNGNFVVSEVIIKIRRADGKIEDVATSAARASIEQTFAANKHPDKKWSAASTIKSDKKAGDRGWAILPDVTKPQRLQITLQSPLAAAAGDELLVTIKQQHGAGGHTVGRFRLSTTDSTTALEAPLGDASAEELLAIIRKPAADRSPEERTKIRMAFQSVSDELKTLREQLAAAQKSVTDYEASLPRTLISNSMAKPRLVRILPRGNWLDESGEVVCPALPQFLNTTWDARDRALNRLDLAQWLIDRRNPLTARVFITRLWKQFFGIGLSKNLDDLGAQGEAPANQAVLDTLAVEFMESGWRIKHMVRLIVNSKTYRQASQADPQLLARDPENRLVARQSRFRLPAELVRDNALAISGLLVKDIGGPSVKPYQPDDYWENLNFPPRKYGADQGPAQYRRGLYIWWQRSFVHPSMLAFDAPTREECTADRPQSNIPQQALVLLNDPTYVEAARVWATQLAKDTASSVETRVQQAFTHATSRVPTADEARLLIELFEQSKKAFAADGADATALLKIGQSAPPADVAAAELAAWTQITRAILNLHEVVTRN
ncbi:MAG: PSD1 and planctomycete cytochrome C domain-containing protein [Pirellulales bacterium]